MNTGIKKGHLPEPLSGRFTGSFAYLTIKDRLPVILTKAIDGMVRKKTDMIAKYGQGAQEEMKEVINRLSKLKNELTTDKSLLEFYYDKNDVLLWNEKLREAAENDESEGRASWFTSSWLLVECYLYRRIQEAYDLSLRLKHYDPFEDQKQTAFINSLPAIQILAAYLRDANTYNSSNLDDNTNKRHFSEFLQLALWSNKCDLSMSSGAERSQTSNPLAQLTELASFVLVNDTESIWNYLVEDRPPKTFRVDIILDNAGFELFADLCLADFLMSTGLVQRIKFHMKQIPWFVSDVTVNDFKWTLQTAKQQPQLAELATRWDSWMSEGVWTIEAHHFWTLPHDYSLMENIDKAFYSELAKANLLIFKGDLNYRKLAGDLKWPHTTSFKESLRGFQPTALCSLRTLKADIVVGLSEGQSQLIEKQNENWMISGDYAVIQFQN